MSSSFRHERVQATGAGRAAVWAAANDGSEDSKYWSDHAVQAVSVSLVGGGQNNNNQIVLTNHETGATDSCTGLAVGTKYYCTVARPAAGTVELRVYSDAARTALVDALSVSVGASRAWRYLYGCNSYHDNSGATLTFDVEHLAAPVDRATDLYYNESWQVLEERRDGDLPAAQYLWDQRYIDAPVMRWRDADGSAANGLEETLYYCNDANMNITALVAESGTVCERYVYAPYGPTKVLEADWTSDPNNVSDFANERQLEGYEFNPETGLHLARSRYYDCTLAVWTSRDSIGYGDGMNLYTYCGRNPVTATDPTGQAEERVVCEFVRDEAISPARLEAIIPNAKTYQGGGEVTPGLAKPMGIWSRQYATLWKCCDASGDAKYIWGAPDVQVGYTLHTRTTFEYGYAAIKLKGPIIIPVPFSQAIDIGKVLQIDLFITWVRTKEPGLPGRGSVGRSPAVWKDGNDERNVPPGYKEVGEGEIRGSFEGKPVPPAPAPLPDNRPKEPYVPAF